MKKKPKKYRTPFRQGEFHPQNKDKYKGKYPIIFRSSWERQYMQYCDRNPSILEWSSESQAIPYFDKISKKKRRYFIDFSVSIKDSKGEIHKYLVEIKPHKQTLKPEKGRKSEKNFLYESLTYVKNCCKWEAATQYAKKRGMKFILLTEKELFKS